MCTGTHAFIPAANTARVRMVYSYLGQTVMNVFYWKAAAPFGVTELDDLINAVITAWQNNFKPNQNVSLTLNYVEATALDSESAAQRTIAVNEAGTVNQPPMPGNVTIAIKFTTGLTGRSNRGRMFFLGLNTASTTGNDITTSEQAALEAAVIGFFADVATATGFDHSIVSYCNNGAWRATANVETVSAYVLADTHLDSQRRRLAGRGM